MSAAKHTPGPWELDDLGNVCSQAVHNIALVFASSTRESWSGSDFDTQAHCEANARLIAAAPDLLEALKAHQEAEAMPTRGDSSDFVWPKAEMRQPGETASGWICEKHGLGYQSVCICCRDDLEAHSARKDRNARAARDDALRAAREKGIAAIAKAEGAAS